MTTTLDYVARGPYGDRQTAPEIASEHVSPTEAMLRQLQQIAWLLDNSADVEDFRPSSIVATDEQRALREQFDTPIRGGRRWIVGNGKAFGGLFPVPGIGVAQATDLLPPDSSRMGGMISQLNGVPAVVVCLGPARAVQSGEQVPMIALPSSGQWNFKLGDVVWGGSVSIFSTSVAGSVYVAVT